MLNGASSRTRGHSQTGSGDPRRSRTATTKVQPEPLRVDWTELDVPTRLLPRGLTLLETKRGVLAVLFERQDAARLRRLPRLARLNVELHQRRQASPAGSALMKYTQGLVHTLDQPLDFSLATDFEQRVFTKLMAVAFGELTTYGKLAERVGKPRASRAIGGAMQRNPLPLFVPCHRVIASDGSLGGFGGGLALKRRLLDLEGIAKLAGGWPRRPGTNRNAS